jgi:penicillin amidase
VSSDDYPYVINPSKGYVVSANNLITSDNVKHGISHSFVFQHRAARISELIEQKIGEGKVGFKQMKEIQLDVVDIQARESLHDMLECVKAGIKDRDLTDALSIFEEWDFKFTTNSVAANLFNTWENTMALYLHETTIGSKEVRVSLQNHPAYLSAFYVKVREWAKEP